MLGAPAQALGEVFRDAILAPQGSARSASSRDQTEYATICDCVMCNVLSCLVMSCHVLSCHVVCLFDLMRSYTCQCFLLVQRGQEANRSSKQPSGAAHCHPWWEFHRNLRNLRNLLPFRIEIKYFLIFSHLDLSWPHAKRLWCAAALDLMWEYPASPARKRSCKGRQQPAVWMELHKIPLFRFAAC